MSNVINIKSSFDFDTFLFNFQESDLFNTLLETEADRSYHEDGTFGLTHAQTMEGWREYLEYLSDDITADEYTAIETEINECWEWHKNNGSLDDLT